MTDKFCKDCAHFEAGYRNYPAGFGACVRPTGGVSPVSGNPYKLGNPAIEERAFSPGLIFNRNRCGPDGRHFEPAS